VSGSRLISWGQFLSKPSAIGDLIRGRLATLGIAKQVKEAGVAVTWPELVGPEIAAHTRVIKLDHGKLFVSVDEPAWRHELTYQKQIIREKINASLGEGEKLVDEIMFTGP
jgi:predicted nucleic acid-binding Zn ribbon protein